MNNFINECISAPRINGMAEFFSSTASGEKHKPFRLVEIDDRLFILMITLSLPNTSQKTAALSLIIIFAVYHTARKKSAD